MRSLSTVEKENVEFLYFMNETTNVAMNEDIHEIQRNSTSLGKHETIFVLIRQMTS